MIKKYAVKSFWFIIAGLSVYYLYRAVRFRFFANESLAGKAFWYYLHLASAIAPLLLGPFQFWTWLRTNYTSFHRLLGKLYLIGSLFGSLSAFYLGITIDLEGSVVPLFLLSLTWLFMTICAWISILNKNVIAHRLFAIRSYALALVFVFLRLVGDIPQEKLFFFIKSPAVRDTTLEWISWIVPLLTVELIFSWLPSLKKKGLKNKKQ